MRVYALNSSFLLKVDVGFLEGIYSPVNNIFSITLNIKDFNNVNKVNYFNMMTYILNNMKTDKINITDIYELISCISVDLSLLFNFYSLCKMYLEHLETKIDITSNFNNTNYKKFICLLKIIDIIECKSPRIVMEYKLKRW